MSINIQCEWALHNPSLVWWALDKLFHDKIWFFHFCVPGIAKSLIQPYNLIQVPVAAAVYYDDMYVNFKLALDTASQIEGIRPWITNEYMHSGLRDGGGQVLGHLLGMLKGKKPLF